MPPKRKKEKVPRSAHHPSQSSVAVPLQIKEEVKRIQENKCWLCDQKSHKTHRPLEICHVFPQAISKRYRFVTHHIDGRTQLHNIHDRANLVALCSICHFALDNDEWTFIPEDTTNWTQRIKATPQIIQEYNSQRNVAFRRLLLIPDPDSKAFQDNHYKSAFTDSPTKIWSGEPGVVVVRPPAAPPLKPTAELTKTLDNFGVLQKLWYEYESPCSEENCPICQNNNEGEDGEEDGEEDGGEDGEEDGGEDGEEDGGEDGEEDGEEDGGEDGEEDEEGDEDFSSSRNSTKGTSERQLDGQQPPLQDFDTKKSIQANKHGKRPEHTRRGWMTSAPYDKSIPYSHRYGYTWAGSTSNELMELWQAYRKPVDN